MDLEQAIRERRTIKRFTGEAVAREAVERLLDLAVWAPNHHHTEPWRFVVACDEAARSALAEAVDQAYTAMEKPDADAAASERLGRKRKDMRERIGAAGAIIFVTAERASDADLDRENYAAACCAVQNLLLAAHGRGLGGYWSTGRALRAPAVRGWLGIGDEAERAFVACVFLGHPAPGSVRASPRVPAREKTRFLEGASGCGE